MHFERKVSFLSLVNCLQSISIFFYYYHWSLSSILYPWTSTLLFLRHEEIMYIKQKGLEAACKQFERRKRKFWEKLISSVLTTNRNAFFRKTEHLQKLSVLIRSRILLVKHNFFVIQELKRFLTLNEFRVVSPVESLYSKYGGMELHQQRPPHIWKHIFAFRACRFNWKWFFPLYCEERPTKAAKQTHKCL